jgi:hypothetical protein
MLEHMFEVEETQGVRQVERPIDEGPIVALDGVHARISHSQREFLSLIVEVDRSEAWRGSGARDLAHWLSMRYGISEWKARRWIAASQVLDGLPRLAEAFARGLLGIDKVVELCRFATSETEVDLIRWAEQVSCASVRHRGDIASRASTEEVVEAERSRTLTWWHLDEGRRVGLEAELPAAQGAVVIRAIERMAERVPQMPDESDVCFAPARRADALAAICSAHIGSDADPDRATLMIHAHLDSPSGDVGACELEGGPAIHPESAERLRCNARVQTVLEDRSGNVIGLGRLSREPSAWMIRQIRYRDRGCRFPGCGTRAFTQAHHIVWWRHGGRTDLDNLLLICSFHHRVVHEHGWSVRRDPDGMVGWFRPDGTRYRAGPSSGASADERLPIAATG